MAHGLAKSCEKSARQEVNDLKAALRNKEEELCDLRVRRRLTEEESGQDRVNGPKPKRHWPIHLKIPLVSEQNQPENWLFGSTKLEFPRKSNDPPRRESGLDSGG